MSLHSITSDAADHAVSLANHTASAASKGWRGMTDRALDAVGLMRKPGPLAPITWIGLGLLVGGLAVALFTPSSGRDLRRRVRDLVRRADEPTQKMDERVSASTARVAKVVENGGPDGHYGSARD